MFFFFNDTATTEIYTLSLHDALPISSNRPGGLGGFDIYTSTRTGDDGAFGPGDRKSTRLNSSHLVISYAVFCLKKKKKHRTKPTWIVSRANNKMTEIIDLMNDTIETV